MTYTKPTLSALDLHVDVASCKPCPGSGVNGLCSPVKTAIVIRVSASVNVPVSVSGPSLPTTPDGLVLLP